MIILHPHSSRTRHAAMCFSLLFWLSCGCLADQVSLKNGDRLTGSVVKSDGKSLVFKSDLAGQVTIPWDAVTHLESTGPLFVGLKGGQVVAGTVKLGEGKAEIKSAETGTVSAQRADISYVNSKDAQAAYEREINRLRNPSLLDLWTGFVDLGMSESRGNARTSTLTTSADATRTTTRDKIDVHFTSIYASNSTTGVQITTADAMRGGITYNANVTPRLFAFGATDLEYDQFQSLDLRFAPSGGLGYSAWKNNRGFFNLMGGVSMDREFFSTGLNRTSAEALAGEELQYKFGPRTTFQEELEFYPNMSDTGNYRMNFDMSANTAIRKWIGWQFTVSDRLLSDPVFGRRKNDLLLTTGVRLTFAR